MSKQLLDDLLEELLEIRGMVSSSEIPLLVENSIRDRSMSVLLVEAMRNSNEVVNVIKQAKEVLQRYQRALQAAKPAPAYLVKLLADLQKQLQSREKGFAKASKSDDIRVQIKYKDSVSDTGILVVAALRTIRNGIDAVNKLVDSLGDEAFNSEEPPSEESEDAINNFEKLIGQTFADKSLGAILKPEVRTKFENELKSKVEKPSFSGGSMRRFFSSITKSLSGLKVDPDKLVASLALLTLDDIRDLDAEIKSLDQAVKKTTETAEETADDLQADADQGTSDQESESAPEEAGEDAENASVEKNRFYRYTKKNGQEGIVKVVDVQDDGKVQLAPVIFKNNKMALGNNVFALQAEDERIGNELEEKEVRASFENPTGRVENTIAASENVSDAVDALADVATEDLVDAAASSKNRMKISREQGIKMFNDMVKDQDKATLLYSTVKRLVNQDVGYDMFEGKQEINNFDRWAQLAGIKGSDK